MNVKAPSNPTSSATSSVSAKSSSLSPGEIVPVTITRASSQTLTGEESLLARAAG
jgi:hypothetical protein